MTKRDLICNMDTRHILNFTYGPNGVPPGADYTAWMRRACGDAFECSLTNIRHTQLVLGRQDFCTVGLSYRNWVWVRPFEVTVDEQVEVWHWRLFVSKRGHSLEIEAKDSKLPEAIALAGLADFIKTWTTEAKWDAE